NGVRNLVADFVGMPFGDRLGCEKMSCHKILPPVQSNIPVSSNVSNKKTPGTRRLRVSHSYLPVSRRIWHLTHTRRLSGFTGPVPSAALDKHGIHFVAGDIVAFLRQIVKKVVRLF